MADKTGYIGRNPNDSAVTVARQFFTASGVTTTFTFASGYLTGFLDVYVDGVKRRVADEFTATDGSTFDVLQGGVSAGSTVEAVAYKAFNAAAISGDITGNFDVSGNTTLGGSLNVTGGTTFSNINVTGIATLGAGTTVAFANTAFNLGGTPDITIASLSAVDINVSGAATIGGILTYEDVTNIDSLGIVTARTGVEVTANGLVVNAGVSTFAADVSVADKIVHTGDANTAIRFPSNDTFTVETSGTERLRVDSNGDVGLVGIATATGLVVVAGSGVYAGHAGVVTAVSFDGNVTGNQSGGSIDATTGAFSGNVTLQANLDLQDDDKILLGTGDDLEIYHDGSNNYIAATSGSLFIRGSDLVLEDADGNDYITCSDGGTGGTIALKHLGSTKLTTTSTGVVVTGISTADGFEAGDDERVKLGNDQDLQLYHDGSNSWLVNSTGDLSIRNLADDKDVLIQSDDGSGGFETYFQADGSTRAAKLFYSASVKLETKSDGVDITGELQCDSLDVDGTTNFDDDVAFTGASYNASWDKSANSLKFADNAKIQVGSGEDLEIHHDGTNSVIDNNTGDLNITTTGSGDDIYLDSADDIYLRVSGNESGVSVIGDGAVELYHNNSKKLETSSAGVTVTGTLNATTDVQINGKGAATTGKAIAMAMVFG